MNDKELTTILGRCLDQIASGETVSACLAEHPEHAAELGPLLVMAQELGALRDYPLSAAARQRTRLRLLRAEAARNEQHGARWWQPGAFAVSRLAAGLIVVMLCVLVTTGMVVASQPGDLAYGVRVAVERAPALLARGEENRTRTELGIAARRFADLDRTMSSREQRLDKRTVAALMASTQRAAALAVSLPEAEQAEISARIAEQARRIAQLGQISRNAQDGAVLQETAERMLRVAERVRAGVPPSGAEPGGSGVGLTQTPPQDDRLTPTAEHTPAPASSATKQPTLWPAHAATPLGPDPGATALHLGPSVTPVGPGPSATPPAPASTVTPLGAGPSATPQGPKPSATALGPGPSPTPPGPGPNATAPEPAPAATAEGPGPDQTSPGPGSGSDQGEGHGSGH
jgi:hypothetical protein